MIFQILVGQTLASFGNYPTSQIIVPFTGKCRVKLVKIDYSYNTGGAIAQRLVAINSRVFVNNTLLTPTNTPSNAVLPPMGRILFFNTTNPYFGHNFVIDDILINGIFDITLSDDIGNALPIGFGVGAVNGGYTNCLITLDIEYMN